MKLILEQKGRSRLLGRGGRRAMAWHLRHECGWTLERIGRRLGVKYSSVSRLLQRTASAEESGKHGRNATLRVPARYAYVGSLACTPDA